MKQSGGYIWMYSEVGQGTHFNVYLPRVHLLLTDVVLPKLSGRAAAERIRAIDPRVKVLYMSGYTDDEFSRHGVLEPGIVLLQKPFTPDDLTRRVGAVLDGE